MNEQYVLARLKVGGARSPLQIGEATGPNELLEAACLRLPRPRVSLGKAAPASNDTPGAPDLADGCMVLDLLAADVGALFEPAFLGATQHQGGKR